MDVLVLAARILLAAVFLAAGIAKLFDSAGSRRAMEEFGVPLPLSGAAALLLPLAEIAVAVLLLPAASARYGALGAFGLAILFASAITYNLARGHRPECHCFGQLHSHPIGPGALARVGLLCALAAFAVVAGWSEPGSSVTGAVASLDGGELAIVVLAIGLVLALALGAWAFVQLLQQQGRLLVRLDAIEVALDGAGLDPLVDPEGIPVGRDVPSFTLRATDGRVVDSGNLTAGGAWVALVFTSPDCAPCAQLMPTLADREAAPAAGLEVAVVSSGPLDVARGEAERFGLELLVDEGRAVARLFDAVATPSAVLIAPDGTVASGVARGQARVESLLRRAARAAAARTDTTLRAADGHEVAAALAHNRHARVTRARESLG